jgi:hypothetical protein
MAFQAMLQELCRQFNKKMYRLDPDVSTGFYGLHKVVCLNCGYEHVQAIYKSGVLDRNPKNKETHPSGSFKMGR